jgi:hypothetical protein
VSCECTSRVGSKKGGKGEGVEDVGMDVRRSDIPQKRIVVCNQRGLEARLRFFEVLHGWHCGGNVLIEHQRVIAREYGMVLLTSTWFMRSEWEGGI